MQTVNCVLCGSDKYTVVWDKTERLKTYGKLYASTIKDADGNILNGTVVLCTDCGMIFTNPRMTEVELEIFYRDEYRKIYGKNIDGLVASQVIHARHALEALRDIRFTVPPTLLDVGCSTGTFIEMCQKHGMIAFGIEPNLSTFTIAKNKGLSVANVGIENFNSYRKYDILTIQNTLEHLVDPVKMLGKARELLEDGGCLLISVPDFLTTAHYTHPDAWFSCAHLYHFTHLTLTQLLEKCGFKEVASFGFQESIGDKLICLYKKCDPKEPVLVPHKTELINDYLASWSNIVLTNYVLRVECSEYKEMTNPMRRV